MAMTLLLSAASLWCPGVFWEDTSNCLIDRPGEAACALASYTYLLEPLNIQSWESQTCSQCLAWREAPSLFRLGYVVVPPQTMRAETPSSAFFYVCGLYITYLSISQKVRSMGPELGITLLDQIAALSKMGRYVKEA